VYLGAPYACNKTSYLSKKKKNQLKIKRVKKIKQKSQVMGKHVTKMNTLHILNRFVGGGGGVRERERNSTEV
jgi:hypothetical protein